MKRSSSRGFTVSFFMLQNIPSISYFGNFFFTLYNLRAVPTNTEVFFAQFMTMREKQILARASGIQKQNWG